MTRATKRPAIYTHAQSDALAQQIFGIAGRDLIDQMKTVPLEPFAIELAIRIINGTDIPGGTDIGALVDGWAREDTAERHPGGRPTVISPRGLLTVMLAHAIAGEGLITTAMGDSLATRICREDRIRMGLADVDLEAHQWAGRLHTAEQTLEELISPFPLIPKRLAQKHGWARGTRQKMMTAAERRALAAYHRMLGPERLERYQARLDDLTFQIIANTIRMAAPVLGNHTGDIALDATYTRLHGTNTPKTLDVDAKSTTPEAGNWGRHGNHEGRGTSDKYKFGLETDIVTITAGDAHVPTLILGVTVHRPGAIKGVAEALLPRIATLGLGTGNLSVDRAYNNLGAESFHIPALELGWDFVFDYPSDELGLQHNYIAGSRHGEKVPVIMVEGTWYLAVMPENLIKCVEWSRLPRSHKDHVSPEQLALNLKAREDYELKRFARRQDGRQRYQLPTGNYPSFDPVTLKKIPRPTVKFVSIPLVEGMRWAQKYPYKSEKWERAFALRSTIERKNRELKHRFTDLDNPDKRPYRGIALNALAVGLLAAAHNIRVLDTYLLNSEGTDTTKSRHRVKVDRRRRLVPSLGNTHKPRDGRSRAARSGAS